MMARNAELTTWTEKGGDRLDITLYAENAHVSGYTRIGYIGIPIILEEKYDPDQAWLPFMNGVILRYPPEDYYYGPEYKHNPRQVAKMAARPVQILPRYEKMFDYVDKDQCVLPFIEYRYVSAGEYSRAKWLWPIDQHGRPTIFHPLTILGSQITQEKFVEWGIESFAGRFAIDGGRILFEKEVDWILTKLRFYGT
jgi:hypothetical protein